MIAGIRPSILFANVLLDRPLVRPSTSHGVFLSLCSHTWRPLREVPRQNIYFILAKLMVHGLKAILEIIIEKFCIFQCQDSNLVAAYGRWYHSTHIVFGIKFHCIFPRVFMLRQDVDLIMATTIIGCRSQTTCLHRMPAGYYDKMCSYFW